MTSKRHEFLSFSKFESINYIHWVFLTIDGSLLHCSEGLSPSHRYSICAKSLESINVYWIFHYTNFETLHISR